MQNSLLQSITFGNSLFRIGNQNIDSFKNSI